MLWHARRLQQFFKKLSRASLRRKQQNYRQTIVSAFRSKETLADIIEISISTNRRAAATNSTVRFANTRMRSDNALDWPQWR